MASVGGAKFLLCLVLWLWNSLPSCQGKQNWYEEYHYPFIRNASTFSSPPSISTTFTNKAYDYIIVGGGTAGCPLAATLSQNFSVLLLERGGVPFTNSNVSFLRNFHITLADLSPTSASQYFCSTDGVYNARARVLGGGSSINAGFYTRANPGFIQNVGWDAKLVNKSYPWVEKQIVHRPNFSPYQRAVRDSLLDSGVSPFNGFTYDHIYGTKVGGTTFDRFGRRHTSAELLASGNPDKLTVLIHATVEAFKGGFILSKVANAWSAGELRLINTNVEDNPSVTFNYFSHPFDLQRCVEGIRLATKVVQSQHITNYTLCERQTTEKLLNLSVKANVNLIPKHANDTKSLEQFCKDTVITIWHYHGGCHVGKVVSTDYKVLGVDRLRVVDGSTFTESPGTNPQATQ